MPEDNYYFERLFKKRKKFRFSKDREILDLIYKNIKQKGNVLDLGIGESGNFIELAKKGFDVTVVDISKTIIKEIEKIANKEKISVKTINQDIRSIKFIINYDVILCIALLHFLTRKKGYELIQKMKKHTKRNGINIIIGFRRGDKSQSEKDSFYLKRNELKNFYYNWKVLFYKDYEDKNGKLSFIVTQN